MRIERAVADPRVQHSLLADTVAACHACELHANGRPGAVGTGDLPADLLVVADTARDLEQLVPLLRLTGLEFATRYLTALVKHEPVGDPPDRAVEICSAWLVHELAVVDPDVVLLIGERARTATTPLHGVHDRRFDAGRPVRSGGRVWVAAHGLGHVDGLVTDLREVSDILSAAPSA